VSLSRCICVVDRHCAVTICAVSVTTTYRGHRLGKVLESQVVRGEQSGRTAGDDVADTVVQLTRRGDCLRATPYQRLLPGEPRTRRVSIRHTSRPTIETFLCPLCIYVTSSLVRGRFTLILPTCDRQTNRHSIHHPSIASRGKKTSKT